MPTQSRYCGNDPVDRSDPTGLADNSASGRYSPLTMFGGGDWIMGSDGLSAWDWNHGMGMNKWQAGPDKAGGGTAADNNAHVNFAPAQNPIHYQPEVYRNNKDGTTTKAGSKTVAELSVEPQSSREATLHLTVHEYYALSAGPNFRAWADAHEHKDNAQRILDWYRSSATQLKAMAVRPQGSAREFQQSVDGAVRPSFKALIDKLQIRADVLGAHIPRYPDGRMIPYNE